VVARLPEFRCIAVDMRGHGLSSQPEPPYLWRYSDAALSRLVACGCQTLEGGYNTLAAARSQASFEASPVDPVILSVPRTGRMPNAKAMLNTSRAPEQLAITRSVLGS
jgi:hypothetical protein